jgi:hypothetical protein
MVVVLMRRAPIAHCVQVQCYNRRMLALSDTALAHLAIAATAVPQAKRRRWLHELAAELDGDPNQNRSP